MKTKMVLFLLAGLSLGAASTAFAGPGADYWQRMRTAEQFGKLKAGDRVLYVCNQCQTLTEKTIVGPAEAMVLCKENSTVTCPACKMQAKVTYRGGRNGASALRETVYTNENGEPCFFVAKAPAKK